MSPSAATDTEPHAVALPGKIDLLKLANETSHALEKLTPIYVEGNKWYGISATFLHNLVSLNFRSFFGFGGPPRIMRDVATQTTGYVRAINGSIDASKFGHTLAEEAIGITKYILEEGALTPELDDYARTATDLAKQGKEKAGAALKLFLDAETQSNKASINDILYL
jgi:hypothetical protein